MSTHTNEILLVEDNPSDAKLTIIALQKSNIANAIVHLKDGQEALDYIFCTGAYKDRKSDSPPSLIILDLKMPKVNGLEVLKVLKADEKARTIPVTVFTSSKEDPDVNECYRLGVNSYVVKPLDFEQFTQVVKELKLYWLVVNHPPSITP